MKRLVPVVLFAFLGMAFSSCCTKIACAGDEVSEIQFYGFDAAELEQVLFIWYDKDNTTDTVFTTGIPITVEDDHYKGSVSMDLDHNYKIKSLSAGWEYSLADFATTTEKCKVNGPLCHYDMEVLSTYHVNGQMQAYDGHALKIIKP